MSIFVSGFEFHRLSKWSFCPRYPVKFEPSEIKENDIVFLNLDCFERFIQVLEKCSSLTHKFKLITHNSDKSFTRAHLIRLLPFIPHIYALNNTCIDTTVTTIPIGFVDNRYKPHYMFKELHEKLNEKTILAYLNFSIQTNVLIRQICYNHFKPL